MKDLNPKGGTKGDKSHRDKKINSKQKRKILPLLSSTASREGAMKLVNHLNWRKRNSALSN